MTNPPPPSPFPLSYHSSNMANPFLNQDYTRALWACLLLKRLLTIAHYNRYYISTNCEYKKLILMQLFFFHIAKTTKESLVKKLKNVVTQGLSSHIVSNVNVKRVTSKHINYYWHSLQYFYYIMKLGSKEIWLLAKQKKFRINFYILFITEIFLAEL